MFSEPEMLRPTITYLLETLWITIEVSRNHFFSIKKLWINVTPSALLGITVQGMKSKKMLPKFV